MPTVKITGMSCMHCVNSVTTALSNVKGVKDVKVDLQKGEATYKEEGSVSLEAIKEAITAIGFGVAE